MYDRVSEVFWQIRCSSAQIGSNIAARPRHPALGEHFAIGIADLNCILGLECPLDRHDSR